MKIVNYILFLTAIFLIYYCIKNFKILKTKLNFNNIESFTSFNMSDYIPSEWDESPTGFGRNTTGCGSNPNKIWTIKDSDDVKDVNDDIDDDQLIFIDGTDLSAGEEIDADKGTIKLSGKKNITIIGINAPSEHGVRFNGSISIGGSSDNIIIRNIYFTGTFEDGDHEDNIGDKPGDLVTIKGDKVKNIWVDHCTFIKSADGLLDMTNGATNITVSWCILGDPTKSRNRKDGNSAKKDTTHHKVMLIGAGDHSNGSSDEQRDMKVQITIHHCWFPGNSRNPRIRYARPIHLYNNFYDQNSYYTIAARQKTISLSENSFFYRSGRPYDTENDGKLYIIGDTYKDTCTSDPQPLHMSEHSSAKLSNCAPSLGGTGDEGNYVFQKDDDLNDIMKDRNNNNETYDYVLDNAEDVPALVTSKAGAGGNGFPGYTIPSGINSGIVTTAAQDESGATGADESGATGADESGATGADESGTTGATGGADESGATGGTDESGTTGATGGTDESGTTDATGGTDESGTTGATGGTDESGTTGATGVTNSDNVTVTHNSGSTSQNNSNYWNSECKQQWGAADWKNGCDGIDEDSCKTSGTWAYSNGMPFLCEWKNSKCVNKSSCLIKGSESSGQEGTVNPELRGGLVPIGDGYVDSSPPESLGFGQGHLQPGTRQTLDSARKTAESEYNAYKEHETAFTVAQNAVQNTTNKLNKWAAHDNLEKCTPDGNGINYRAIAKAKLEEDFNKPALINEAQTKWNNRANNGINTWFLESDLNKGYLTSAMEGLINTALLNGNTLKPLTSEVANAIKVHKNEKKRIDDTTFLPLNFPDEDLVCADDIEWKTDGKVWSSRKAYEDAMNDREQKQIDYNEKLTEKQRLKYVWQQAEHDYHDNERKIARKALSTVQLNMVN